MSTKSKVRTNQQRDLAALSCLVEFASADPTRINIAGIYVVSPRRLEATDGTRAIILELATGVDFGFVAQAHVGKLIDAKTAIAKVKMGVTLEAIDCGMPYPLFERVWPRADIEREQHDCSFSPALLGSSLGALAKLDKNSNVQIYWPRVSNEPVRLVPASPDFLVSCVVMPMRGTAAKEPSIARPEKAISP